MNRKVLFALIGVLGVVVASLSGYLVVSFMVRTSDKVEVPTIVGLSLSEALDVLNQKKLDLEVREFTFSQDTAENLIVRQRPAAGSIVRSGRSVGVVLSRGPQKSTMPDVLGKSIDLAAIALNEAGFKSQVAGRGYGVEKDMVIAQSKLPGAFTYTNETIGLYVGDGPRPVVYRAPKLEGLQMAEAEARVAAMGLRIERIEEVKLESEDSKGMVVSQEPLPGYPIQKGAGISLSVAQAQSN